MLVIDDDVDAANSLSYLLQIAGYPTAVAYGGEMGLRIAKLFKPALVFLDLQMPGETAAKCWPKQSETEPCRARSMSA